MKSLFEKFPLPWKLNQVTTEEECRQCDSIMEDGTRIPGPVEIGTIINVEDASGHAFIFTGMWRKETTDGNGRMHLPLSNQELIDLVEQLNKSIK